MLLDRWERRTPSVMQQREKRKKRNKKKRRMWQPQGRQRREILQLPKLATLLLGIESRRRKEGKPKKKKRLISAKTKTKISSSRKRNKTMSHQEVSVPHLQWYPSQQQQQQRHTSLVKTSLRPPPGGADPPQNSLIPAPSSVPLYALKKAASKTSRASSRRSNLSVACSSTPFPLLLTFPTSRFCGLPPTLTRVRMTLRRNTASMLERTSGCFGRRSTREWRGRLFG
mmetsp:Transcript_5850/g.11379  ORF Transcript_5850/g.11379 Transcript_5850/m.11379 type:complete len:227 (+) Transcript_5850:1330-2010(+)